MNKQMQPMSPEVVHQFAETLHERRCQIAPPFTRSSRLHQRELGLIDDALARIRRGSYGTCEECGSQIEYLHLFMNPTSATCLACLPQARTIRTA